jgi:hypothetical protein
MEGKREGGDVSPDVTTNKSRNFPTATNFKEDTGPRFIRVGVVTGSGGQGGSQVLSPLSWDGDEIVQVLNCTVLYNLLHLYVRNRQPEPILRAPPDIAKLTSSTMRRLHDVNTHPTMVG